MGKELEALEELKMQVGNIHYFDFSKGYPNQTTIELRDSELFTTIEKSLKALEIIKKYVKVDENGYFGFPIIYCGEIGNQLFGLLGSMEEYELLKEIFDE